MFLVLKGKLTHGFGRCLAHVLNLAVGDFMSAITKTAAMETTQAIWEYDPADPHNRVLGGSVDVIAALRTLGVKVSLPFSQCFWLDKQLADASIRPANPVFPFHSARTPNCQPPLHYPPQQYTMGNGTRDG